MRYRVLIAMIAAAIVLPAAAGAQPTRQELDRGWEFRQGRGYNWYPAEVPGVVHTDLMAAGIIDDPFMRLNERAVQWVDKEDWIYRTRFDADPELLGRENIELVFEGLDTYADVTLNGQKIISADNMFRSWTADVKGLLRPQDNELEVYFHSPIKVALPMWEATPWRDIIESGNDQSANGGLFNARVGVFVRKAGYHFGWDWGPRLVTSGIWRPVYLEAWDDVRIDDVFYRQMDVDSKRADIRTVVSLETGRVIPDGEITITNKTDGRRVARYRGALGGEMQQVALEFTVRNPRLWWTNGLGGQPLYEFEVEVRSGGKVVDRHTQKLGLRSLRVVTQPDQWGESFYVELNGVPVFMKGANYIPCDNFLPRVTDQIYEKTVLDAVAANMNMLRVWGGGIYEEEVFYDLCDQYGILVWQDFMFACALYPAEGQLMENIRHEAIENVKRLRNHTCLALWCGNNECLDMWFNWGVKRRYDRTNPEWSQIQWQQFTDLYYNVLPQIVEQYHPGVCYRKSSPYSDDYGVRSDSVGDYHDWDVWGQALEFDLYNRKKSRFFSEYGFQGFPSFQSVKKFAPQQRDWAVTSEVMLSHQRAGTAGNQKIESMLTRDYGQPADFERFTYMSQLMQADAMKTAMEAHRRQMPRCMGSLIWQHNDCWPAASWSSRDWYGNWKAQQYAVRRAFDDIVISAAPNEHGVMEVYIVSDRLQPTAGEVVMVDYDVHAGAVVDSMTFEVEVPANTSTKVLTLNTNIKTALWEQSGRIGSRKDVVVGFRYTDRTGKVYTTTFFPHKHKEIRYVRPDISVELRRVGGRGTSGTAVEAGGTVAGGNIAGTAAGGAVAGASGTAAAGQNSAGTASGGNSAAAEYELTLTTDNFARGVCVVVDGVESSFVSDNFFDMAPGESKTLTLTIVGPAEGIEKKVRIITYADARK